MEYIECECGCGESIPAKDSRGRVRRFVRGHVNKGRSNSWKRKPVVGKRASHNRAVKQKSQVADCEWSSIGGCQGRLDVAHLDGDHLNNEAKNVLKLCRCHHRLLDNGRIDPANPVMPKFVVRGGKRRYLYSYSATSRSEAARLREARKRSKKNSGGSSE